MILSSWSGGAVERYKKTYKILVAESQQASQTPALETAKPTWRIETTPRNPHRSWIKSAISSKIVEKKLSNAVEMYAQQPGQAIGPCLGRRTIVVQSPASLGAMKH